MFFKVSTNLRFGFFELAEEVAVLDGQLLLRGIKVVDGAVQFLDLALGFVELVLELFGDLFLSSLVWTKTRLAVFLRAPMGFQSQANTSEQGFGCDDLSGQDRESEDSSGSPVPKRDLRHVKGVSLRDCLSREFTFSLLKWSTVARRSFNSLK